MESEEIEHGYQISWYNEYKVFRCLGCDSISFVKESRFSEDCNPYDDGIVYNYYPSVKTKISLESENIPNQISIIYWEAIDAYNTGAYILVSARLRAVVEATCSSKNVERGAVTIDSGGISIKKNLEGKIYGLIEKGYSSLKQVEALHVLRFTGNTALHEIDKATAVQVNIAFSIIESIIEVIYGIEDKSKKLKITREKH